MTREELYALREGWDFEAKLAAGRDGRGALPGSFWETYSAMANSQGGRIVLGVKERSDGGLEVRGLSQAEKVARDLWNLLENPQKVSANLLGRDDVRLETLDGRVLLVVAVPRAPRQRRPVHVNGDLWNGTYVRVHEGDRRCDRERVRRMLADAEFDSRDSVVLPRYTVADLSAETIQAYRTYFRTTRPDHPWSPLSDEAFLEKLGARGRDRETGEDGVTRAGLLMFGTFEVIREALPHYFVDYQLRPAGTDAIEWDDRVYPDGTWSGNVYDFYRRVILKLFRDLNVPLRLRPDMYRKDETHVHEAVREALVNTLIHADYEGRIAVLVTKRPDGFEFRNPGGLRLPPDQIRRGGLSDCRNRNLQRMFLMLGLGEQAGSGFSRILRAWHEEHWRIPHLTEDVELDTTVLELSHEDLLPRDVLEALEARFPRRFRALDADARLALATAQGEGRVTNRRLQEITNRHPRDLTTLLGQLVVDGFLEPHGERSGSWYTVAGSPAEGWCGMLELFPDDSPPDAQADLSRSMSQTLSQSMSRNPEAIVRSVAAAKWAKREDVEAAILAACRERFVTAREIAERVGRRHATIRKNYLPRLVRDGRLELRDTEDPTSPNQAYRTIAARPGP